MYIITDIKSKPRNFLKALNNNLKHNVNEIEISLQRKFTFLWVFTITIDRVVACGILSSNVNIHRYIKIGDEFDPDQYPMLKIKKNYHELDKN